MTEQPPPPPEVIVEAGVAIRAPRAAGIAGLAFAALFTAALVIMRSQPLLGATDAEIAAWFATPAHGWYVLAGMYLAPFSGIMFLWFIAVIRDLVGEREDRFFATIFFGSGLLFIAMVFAATAAAGSILAGVQFQHAAPPSAASVDFAGSLSYALLFVFATRAGAVFLISTATLGLRTKAFPRWLAYAGIACAVVLLVSVTAFDWVILLIPAWVAVASGFILGDQRRRAAAERGTRTAPS